jgi:hemerythrin superfamily protein
VAKRSDAISVLVDDHRTVEDLFKRFEKTGDRAFKTRADLVARMIRELSIHAAIEEQLFYPRVRLAGQKVEDEVLEGLEEHHVVKELLAEIEKLPPENERCEAKVTVLIENVRHHVDEEEGELFPALRSTMKRKDLQELAQAIEQAKKMAPTHPHPRAPDTPPGNLVAGAAAGAIDKAEDTGKKTVRKILGRTRSRKAS